MADGQARRRYIIGIGSNRGHGRHHRPEALLPAAVAALGAQVTIRASSPLTPSRPLGPSRRRFANGALLVDTPLGPPDLLALLQRIERAFGRRRGRRWGARSLDLDILLWGGGAWRSRSLVIPHPALTARAFALGPAAEVAPRWRLPRDGRRLGAALAALARAKPLDPRRPRP